MTASLRLAHRNLTRHRIRMVASVAGISLALALVLALDAIFAGVSDQLTAYVDRSGADVWVSQAGVRNLHMVASWMPEAVEAEVSAVDGVDAVESILYSTDTISARGERAVAYVIGLRSGANMGGPWAIAQGSERPGRGEAIVDAGFARRAGIGLGDEIEALGTQLRVVGTSTGTATLVNSVAFVSFDDFRTMRGGAPTISFVLVRVESGADAAAVVTAIRGLVPAVEAQTTPEFARQERRLVMDMSADVISIMNVIGFMVGLAVVALTVYVAVLGRRREFGALKALGARNGFLYRVVASQAFLSVAIGFAVGLAFTVVLAAVVPDLGLDLRLSVTIESLAKVASFATVIAIAAALLPIRQIAGLDPASVFRKGGPG